MKLDKIKVKIKNLDDLIKAYKIEINRLEHLGEIKDTMKAVKFQVIKMALTKQAYDYESILCKHLKSTIKEKQDGASRDVVVIKGNISDYDLSRGERNFY